MLLKDLLEIPAVKERKDKQHQEDKCISVSCLQDKVRTLQPLH